ncbi:uncharacterized protein [Anolis sagrei]|uniref:uncharacterized protein n=1 Tax=Anolis sagrei TaxID=38937 RepID=UPI0035216BEC
MALRLLLLLLLCTLLTFCPVVDAQEPAIPSCPINVAIRGGTVTFSDEGRLGSTLTYSCPPGTYPYPLQSRVCQSDGKWTPMRSPHGPRVNTAQCREIRCPPQMSFEHGSSSPRRSSHPIGDVLSFECYDGYQLHGSSQRHCLPNGRWNGTSPVCDDGVGHCRSIAIPPGAIATGGRNRLGDRVSFQCQNGFDLVGSAQRVCTPEGEWSGAEPSCRAPYSYDRAEDVRAEFGASFTDVLSEVSSSGPDPSETLQVAPNLGRRLILSKDNFLYIYMLADASHSVTEANFQIFKKCLEIIINRVASFDVATKFSILSFASQPKTIVDIHEDIAEDPELVLEKMKTDMNYKDHGNATGTNTYAALDAIYRMMINDRANVLEKWNQVRHAIILLTDGKSNLGQPPKAAVRNIEDLVNVRENRIDYLDIYVFGVGNLDVDWSAMNEIASKKPGEKHAFKLENLETLKEAFEDILDPKDLDDICGLANYSSNAEWYQKNPWHVLLQENRQVEPSCRGALISKTWILTSAHCFNKLNDISTWKVILGGGEKRLPIKRRIDHDLYNVRAKVSQGIQEFYDYDISLLELENPVPFGGRIRPICLPCTEGANKALKKKSGTTTCKDHELELLSFDKVPAQFISLDNKRMNVQIKTKKSRPSCISGAVQEGMIYSQVSDVSEVVTNRFLCSGNDNHVEAATCKGESGGSLFVERRERHFQVGVISWGTYDPCKRKNAEQIIRVSPPRNHKPRDFYISLFSIQDWLRQHLGKSLRFIPIGRPTVSEISRTALVLPPLKQGGALKAEPKMQQLHPFACILVALLAFWTDPTDAAACDPETATIIGGNYTLLENGTLLQYSCPAGQYPYPTDFRRCEYNGKWSSMQKTNGDAIRQAKCYDIRCHRPIEFENGMYEPRQFYYNVSQELTFECYGGYTLRGSQKRTCLPNGKWSGETTICDDGAGHCRNPGIPIGARKAGTQYRIEYKVQYTCERGLSLVGSKERVCQESGMWSGAEPECRSPFSYDTPEEVSSKFISSLTETAESSDSDKNVSTTGKRKIKIEKDGSLNIYIVLDASRSIKRDQFKEAQNMSIKLIEKISSYDITPRYAVITFATEVKELVRTTDDQSTDASWVIEKLEGMKYSEHKQKPGTNIQKGLSAVYTMMITQQAAERRRGLNPPPVSEKTRHVIVLLSDGDYNMGGDPIRVIRQIRDFLSIGRNRTHPREDYLDVYVFAVGGTVVMENVNKIASQKSGETHAFKIKTYEDLQLAFEKMIDESETLSMCGLAKEHSDADDQQKNPWYTTITIRRTGGGFEYCKGALVSKYFVLTAAHCFTIDDTASQITVTIARRQYDVRGLYSHPDYQIGRLAKKGIPEFYDYDVALVELASPVMPSPAQRPICLPCTEGATRALRKPHPQTTCRDHEQELLPASNVNSLFVTDCEDGGKKGLRRRIVRIKNGDQKFACEEDAKKADHYKNVTNVADVVTDRFLCTGGFDPQADPNTCKGDSGGPLIIQKRLRYIQVGVISWGVVNVCKSKKISCDPPRGGHVNSPRHARDFHINLFKVMPWLKERLRDEDLGFL